MYLDGVPVAMHGNHEGSASFGATAGVRIGTRLDGINHPFIGEIDEVMMFNRALTHAEMQTLASTNTYPAGTLLMHLPLDVVQ